jgi:hypothetical protein
MLNVSINSVPKNDQGESPVHSDAQFFTKFYNTRDSDKYDKVK